MPFSSSVLEFHLIRSSACEIAFLIRMAVPPFIWLRRSFLYTVLFAESVAWIIFCSVLRFCLEAWRPGRVPGENFANHFFLCYALAVRDTDFQVCWRSEDKLHCVLAKRRITCWVCSIKVSFCSCEAFVLEICKNISPMIVLVVCSRRCAFVGYSFRCGWVLT